MKKLQTTLFHIGPIFSFFLPVVVLPQHSLDKDANVNVSIHHQFYDFLMLLLLQMIHLKYYKVKMLAN